MAVFEAGPVGRQHVRRIAHRFHAAGDDDIGITGHDGGTAHDRGLHAGTAHLVECGGFNRFGKAGLDARLARRGLALASHQHIAHQHLIDIFAGHTGFFHRGLDRNGTEFIGRQRRQLAEQATHRGARHTDNNDRIINCTHLKSPQGRDGV